MTTVSCYSKTFGDPTIPSLFYKLEWRIIFPLVQNSLLCVTNEGGSSRHSIIIITLILC